MGYFSFPSSLRISYLIHTPLKLVLNYQLATDNQNFLNYKMAQNRQLAAIMFTDLENYSHLMGIDEDKALQEIGKKKELIIASVKSCKGEIIKDLGDGTMSKFNSVLAAVKCAIEIQEQATTKISEKIRIGIHIGDIIVQNGDIFGDGVNIAARLQDIADPGGIYVSGSVYKAIRGRKDLDILYLGETFLKNINYPVKINAIQGNGLPYPGGHFKKTGYGYFWTQMRERNVYPVIISYLLASGVLLMLLNTVISKYNLSDIPLFILGMVLSAGLPLSGLFGWLYENSPEGIILSSSEFSENNPFNRSKRKPFTSTLCIALMIIAIIVLAILQIFVI